MMHHYSLTRGEKQKGKRQNDNQEKEVVVGLHIAEAVAFHERGGPGTVKSLVAKPWLKVEQARPLVSSVGIRGISAGQGASCGFGMRGQKSRSGPAVTIGFEGGQMPLYRRIPKLRGIAGEDAKFKEGEEVSLEFLKAKGVINTSGRERRLPLKILGEGELSKKLTLKARAFSTSAKEKLENVGCSLTVLPGRKKWVKPSDNC
ncbi:50S ribosomal protein L15, chloroplastic [Glycine max]|nr:50S ribosomal protein L15, chloroplastic [Glycine max]